MKFSLILLLSCCGVHRLDVRSIEPELQEDYDVLRSGLIGIVEFSSTKNGIDIVVDSDKIQSRADDGHESSGFYDGANKIIVLPSLHQAITEPDGSVFQISSAGRRIVFAHELGHALGLEHSSHGLMMIGIDAECLGVEAKCLIDALAMR